MRDGTVPAAAAWLPCSPAVLAAGATAGRSDRGLQADDPVARSSGAGERISMPPMYEDAQTEGMRRSETRYRRLFETAKDGILIVDATGGRII
jgi:hypothetical protein